MMFFAATVAGIIAVVVADVPPHVECPAQGVAQNDLPCPGKPGDVPLPGKSGTRVLPLPGKKPDPNFCPQNGEGKPELLGLHDVTPIENFYVRSHGAVPDRALKGDLTGWQLQIDGEVEKPINLTMQDLQTLFPVHSRQSVMECAGNGRHGFRPDLLGHGGPADGNQWTIGAVANGNWTGVLLRDVLKYVGLKKKAIFVAWYSEDKDCASSPTRLISRGIDLEKALDGTTMLAWSMNGETIPAFHGFPLRLIVPGYIGGAQGKWLTRLWVRDQVHDGPKMTGWAYRLPKYPIWPGSANTKIPPDQYSPPIQTEIITTLHTRSIITSPHRCTVTSNTSFIAEGRAWSGAGDVRKVELSFDHGMTWQEVDQLSKPVNRFAWQKWSAAVTLPSHGAWRLMSRATDEKGRVQPLMNPKWNPKGYMNNAVMNVDITVTEPLFETIL